MNFDVIATEPFERKIKRLTKKYKSLAYDLGAVIDTLIENLTIGSPIGKYCYKISIAINPKGKVVVPE
jgi:hypothetical protein